MQYKIRDILYVQLFTPTNCTSRVSKLNCFSTKNNIIAFEIILENKYFEVF